MTLCFHEICKNNLVKVEKINLSVKLKDEIINFANGRSSNLKIRREHIGPQEQDIS